MSNGKHTGGRTAPGKVNRNWRILETVDHNLHLEAARQGFTSVPSFLNNLLTRYFNGENIKRELKS